MESIQSKKKGTGTKKKKATKEENSPLTENEGGLDNLRSKTRARFAELFEAPPETSEHRAPLKSRKRSPRGATPLSNEGEIDDRSQSKSPRVKITEDKKSTGKSKKKRARDENRLRNENTQYEESTPDKINYTDNVDKGHEDDYHRPPSSTGQKSATKKKKKAKNDTREVNTNTSDYVDTPKRPTESTSRYQDEASPAKETKKKKDKKGKKKKEGTKKERKEARFVQPPEEEPILAVVVHKADQFEFDINIKHPMVRVHLVNESTGQHVKKPNKDKSVVSYYEKDNEAIDYILPIMTQPFDFKKNKSFVPYWEETLCYNEAFSYFIKEESHVIMFFEVLDFLGMNVTQNYTSDPQKSGWHEIAWGFLKLVGGNGQLNIDKRARLQLFHCPRSYRKKDETIEIYQWWKDCPRQKYPSTLYITVKSIKPQKYVDPLSRSMNPVQKEESKITYDELSSTITDLKKLKERKAEEESKMYWSRLPGQDCRIPNEELYHISNGSKGCLVIKFSHSGRKLAAGCADKRNYPIFIYDLKNGKCCQTFSGHFSIVYDLTWSEDDTELLSASSDGTARTWAVAEDTSTATKILPHPTFIYAAKYHPMNSTVILTGGYDCVVRVWSTCTDHQNGQLLAELTGHDSYINTIVMSRSGERMFSGDNDGCIVAWKTELTSRTAVNQSDLDKFSLIRKITNEVMESTASINHIIFHPNGRQLIVLCKDSAIRIVDLRMGSIIQTITGFTCFKDRIRCAVTPCGTYLISGSEDCAAYTWNINSGKVSGIFSTLQYHSAVVDIDFHPHDNIVAFCAFGDGQPILIYKYNPNAKGSKLDTTVGIEHKQEKSVAAQASTMPLEETGDNTKLKQSLFDVTMERLRVERVKDKLQETVKPIDPIMDMSGSAVSYGIRQSNNNMETWGDSTFEKTFFPPTFAIDGNPVNQSLTYPTENNTSGPMQQQVSRLGSVIEGYDAIDRLRRRTSSALSNSDVPDFRPSRRRSSVLEASAIGGIAPMSLSTVGRRQSLVTLQQPGFGLYNQFSVESDEHQTNLFRQSSQNGQVVNVIHDYDATRSDELSVREGDQIKVLNFDKQWIVGMLPSGQQGYVPISYVAGVQDLLNDSREDKSQANKGKKHSNEYFSAVLSKTGELKIVSGPEDTDDDRKRTHKARGGKGSKHKQKDKSHRKVQQQIQS